ncbi:late blight resistance protein R1-A-like [Quercus lobata]|uniref:late blight resistance protein R1-A-like n=1 Tax=Quercus lobata TaxID=97700 RepID=UPI0012477004|nr:late blight resistance protein R1-A-like [Quercus lobata]
MESIYRKNGPGWQDLDDDELKSLLFKCLEDRRYLVVMDDIWEIEAWNEVSVAFPTNSNGSRVLITSRIKEVALHASSLNNSIPHIPPYELPFLDEDKSWELFSKKVFGGGTCPLELETLGRQIVKSCRGLPLAIVVLGGLLANKEKTHRTWSKYVGHVNSYLTEDRSSCMDILALSYNHLPRRLKSCFLYFGIYPEDFEIPVRQLIRLWIAEGFIRQIGNRNIEDVAEDYLEELIDWSLIQVATKRLDGGVKTCRIHDLLRDLCISESAEEKFLEVCSDIKLSPMSKCRRISIHFANHPYISSNPCESSNIRSVMGFGGVVGLESPLDKGYYLKWLCKSNKLVRVVELSNMAICCVIPKRIENLVLLRYLSISSGARHVIPNSICNLWNLETLDMRNFEIKCLPKGIWKLKKLRYLYLNGPTSLPRTDNKAGLPNLQVLTGIDLNLNSMRLFARARFPNLRKLGLRSASGRFIDIDSVVLSLSSIYPLRHLQTLKLCEFMIILSDKISLQLTKITLLDLRVCAPSTWGVLGSLTNLRILKVVGCGMFTLECNESSFCQLEVLKMAKVTNSEWTMEKGAMPRLQRLVIERCNFKTMPLDELWCLSALRDVEVLHPDPELANMLRQLQMRDGCKLQVYPPLNPFPTTN